MNKIAVIDYGMGNLRSVEKAIEHVAGAGSEVLVTSDPQRVAAADRVVFPGQGAMPDCMREMERRGLHSAIVAAAASKPFLGICIGQQMLFDHSQEGDVAGLGIFRGEVRRFPEALMRADDGSRLKVPHMGWNRVAQTHAHPLWANIEDGARFYFVHSYFVDPAQDGLVAGTTDYGLPFTSAVAKANIFAVQFHPEKSAEAGLQMLRNFLEWQP